MSNQSENPLLPLDDQIVLWGCSVGNEMPLSKLVDCVTVILAEQADSLAKPHMEC